MKRNKGRGVYSNITECQSNYTRQSVKHFKMHGLKYEWRLEGKVQFIIDI